MSCSKLIDQAAAVVAPLAELNVRPDDRVLIMLPDGPGFVESFAGAMQQGAVPLLVNPLLSAHDVVAVAAEAGARLVLVSKDRIRALAKLDVEPPVLVDGPQGLWAAALRLRWARSSQGADMDPELTALTSTVATTVVQLLATAAWEQAKSAVDGLWRRAHPERAGTVQAELEDSRAEVLAARQAGDEQVEQDLIHEWQGRLRRLVAADPQLMDELRRVLEQLRSALTDTDPPQDTTITQQATTFGNSRVNQAGRDLHVTTGE